jgi:hypothetical protein
VQNLFIGKKKEEKEFIAIVISLSHIHPTAGEADPGIWLPGNNTKDHVKKERRKHKGITWTGTV